MAKNDRKNVKNLKSVKPAKKNQPRSRIAENVDCLLELHKLQGVILNQLHKDI